MKNSEWKRKITQTVNAYRKYKSLLEECEKEYESRYGLNPSDVDDDYWINLMHQGEGSICMPEIIESAKRQTDIRK